jgi:hypothetical protein
MSNQNINIRWGWLKIMYWYTIIGAGGFGLGIIVMPNVVRSIFGWPIQDPVIYGVAGSVWMAFGLLAILGLRSPLKFVPILLMQLCYKSVWFIGVVFPLLATGKFPLHGILVVVVMASFIIGDLIAIPFSYVFSKMDTTDYGVVTKTS